jgi:hypothetical protein
MVAQGFVKGGAAKTAAAAIDKNAAVQQDGNLQGGGAPRSGV